MGRRQMQYADDTYHVSRSEDTPIGGHHGLREFADLGARESDDEYVLRLGDREHLR